MKKLPIGIQTFRKIIEENFLYVDKTKVIDNLIKSGQYYFLSRPRRFGKSLLLSTLKEIFLGNKELFKDLYIYNKLDWKFHPVIHLSFSLMSYADSKEKFEQSLVERCKIIAKENNIIINSSEPKTAFEILIKGLSKKERVVILIDEYDKPIVDVLHDLVKAKENREILREFYSVLKDSDEYIKFCFITGVSKFSKISIFSGLNNLKDITLSEDFATLLGITEDELEKYFRHYIDDITTLFHTDKKTIMNEIKKWYNGYSWNGVDKVSNPFSILNFCSDKNFSNYWFASGTPTFLIKLIKEFKVNIEDFEEKDVNNIIFENYDIDNVNIYSLMFQTGYLTIKEKYLNNFEPFYKLCYPNHEVKQALISHLISSFTNNRLDEVHPKIIKLKESLTNGDIENFISIINSQLASIPYTLHLDKEAYYHSLFYMILAMMGVDLDLEVLTNRGRIDGVLETKNNIFVIEFKFCRPEENPSKLLEDAINQIREKKYYQKYLSKQKEIKYLALVAHDKNILWKLA